jgi:hypothetical protein
VDSLPQPVANEAKHFFDNSLERLTGVTRRGIELEAKAAVFATLEGAMILAKGAGKLELFDKIVDTILQRNR